ncbi:hypothetical protein Shyhy01_41590 [Streptomyces hygroscopicus subsp. hygroscopicus]|nr:hypothetical protein [Streptomyces hygroscopicus]GLX51209.1 hypothetical protein Shyhy01_41590 [Streptomyces hygroscopicus subsp. hygroscopicus]
MSLRSRAGVDAWPGAEHVRRAYPLAGDVIGIVVRSRKGGTRTVPFRQTVVLREQLLGWGAPRRGPGPPAGGPGPSGYA